MSTSEPPPGAPIEPTDLLGSVFADRYRLSSLVSEGANTTVFDSVDEQNGRVVTVKLIRPEVSSSPAFRDRFDETMRGAAALSHPNIAAVYDWGIGRVGDASTAYVVVEQLTGGSLRDMFDRARLLSPSQALGVGLDACRALDYAHRRGFVHTELTPSKLVFGDDRRLRITDFGLAHLLNHETWRQPESVPNHTAWYASPEQGLARPIDGKTDVYALCLTMHEAVTGVLPFKNDSTVASLSARVGKLMPVSADLGPLASVLEHAGRPEADERASAAQFGKSLVRAASKLPRPEPLPLLSTGLFETPAERLRSPDDPTGGVTRPLVASPASTQPEPLIVEVHDEPAPQAGERDDLVILPIDADTPTEVTAPVEPPAAEPPAAESPATPEPPATLGPSVDDDAAGPTPTPAVTRTAPVTEAMPVTPAASADTPRRRRGVPWKLLLGALVLAALVVLGLLATRLFATPTYPVPDLVEMPEAEAVNMVAANEWEIQRSVERSDAVPVVGQVVRTAPRAGVELAEGEPFLIVVSGGPELRELPESTGVPLSQAQTRLVERGLNVETTEAFDEDVPVGTVVSWGVPGDPTLTAGSMVEPDTLVQLVVSTGPAPRSIPNVVGLSVVQARSTLDEIGLTLIEGGQEFSDDVPLGSIIAQSLPVDTEVERGAELTVSVSKGPDLVQFPDVLELPFPDAVAALTEAGFTARLTFGDAEGVVRSATVDGRTPDVGETFRRSTQVDIRAL